MKVLAITGDHSFGAGHSRYEIQRSAVESFAVVYWGKGSIWPSIPRGYFDVVTAQDPFWRGLFGWLVARRRGAKLNVQVHTDFAAQSFLRRALARFVLARADSVRVVSEKIKKQITHPRVSVLPVYVEVERFKNMVRSPDSGAVLWVGRFEEEKDPFLALEIIKKIPNAKLVMLGAGSLDKHLRQRGENLPVAFAGWQDPLPYLAKAAVVLSTSRHESWGASIVEALAAGVPVVAPDVGVAKEAGAIVVPRERLAEAVVEVLRGGARGELKLTLLNREEWKRAWRETLV